MENTPNLDLPYILPSQAQKHVTHNEALALIDAVVQLSVKDRGRAVAPSAPVEGDRHIVAAGAGGGWAGRDGAVAAFVDGGWLFLEPRPGWLCWIEDEAALAIREADGWTVLAGRGARADELDRLGVRTTADAVNGLAVKSDAVLFSHDDVTPGSGDVRQVLNKAAAGGTATLLYQTGFSGRAEMGTAGDDDWKIKVSADGSTWNEALSTERATGIVTMPQGVRISGSFGVGRAGDIPGGIYFNRTPDNPFLLYSAGNPASPTNIGQFRASLVANMIGIANPTGAIYGVAYKPVQGRVGIMTSSPENALSVNGIAAPQVDNSFSCGTATYRWSTVYAATGTINTSDERDKEVEAPIGEAAARIVDAVEPVLYRWKVGGIDVVETGTERIPDGEDGDGNPLYIERPTTEERPRPGVRLHAGWLAQDVKAALDAEGIDCGAWGMNEPQDATSRQWLRPDQLVAFLWEALRQTRREMRALADIEPAPQ